MAEKTPSPDHAGESISAASTLLPEPVSSTDSSKPGKKQPGSFTLHPLQDKAIRYLSFMLSDSNKPQTAAQIIQDAIARHLTTMQKQGNEYPPKMLLDLHRLSLIK